MHSMIHCHGTSFFIPRILGLSGREGSASVGYVNDGGGCSFKYTFSVVSPSSSCTTLTERSAWKEAADEDDADDCCRNGQIVPH